MNCHYCYKWNVYYGSNQKADQTYFRADGAFP